MYVKSMHAVVLRGRILTRNPENHAGTGPFVLRGHIPARNREIAASAPPRLVAKALLVIGKEPGIKEEALRKSLKVRKGSIAWNKTAKRLAEHGLAVREEGGYTLTEKGAEHRKAIEERMHANAANLFGALTEEEQKQLHGLMEKAVKAWHAA